MLDPLYKIIKIISFSLFLIILVNFLYSEENKESKTAVKLNVSLIPSKYYYYDEEEVVLRAESRNKKLDLEYQFDFGDGKNTGWIQKNEVRHVYLKPGYFSTQVTIRQKNYLENIKQSYKVKLRIKKTPKLSKLRLTAKRKGVRYINLYIKPGDVISFEAKGDSIGLEYKYFFGDGANSGWVNKAKLTHLYKKKGLYKPYALARRKANKENIVHSEIIKVICRTHDKEEFEDYPVTINLKDETEVTKKKKPLKKRLKRKYVRKRKPLIKKKDRDPDKLYLDLELKKKNYLINQRVTFKAKPTKEVKNIEYQFDFGDGYTSEWQEENRVEYEYEKPGKYSTYVIMRKKLNVEDEKSRETSKQKSVKQNNKNNKTVLEQPGEIVESAIVNLYISPPYRKLLVFIDTGSEQCIVGKPVLFTVHTNKTPKKPVYKFYFGDGNASKWTLYPEAVHTFKKAEIVEPYVILKEYRGHGATMKSDLSPIEVRAIPLSLSITTDKKQYLSGETIQLEAQLSQKVIDAVYRFDFGNGEASKWMEESKIEYSYPEKGDYKIRVQAKINNRFKISSEKKALTILPFKDFTTDIQESSQIKIQPAVKEIRPGERGNFKFITNLQADKIIWAFNNKQSSNEELNIVTDKKFKPGNYTVRLRILSSEGEVHEAKAKLIVSDSIGIVGVSSISLLLLLASLALYYIYAKVQVNIHFKASPSVDLTQIEIQTEGLEIEETVILDNQV